MKNIRDIGYKFIGVLPYSGAEIWRKLDYAKGDRWAVIFLDNAKDNARTMVEFIDEVEAYNFGERLEQKYYAIYQGWATKEDFNN